MAIVTTLYSFLMYKPATGTDYEKLIDIKNVPAIGAERNIVDMTSLTDDQEVGIPGIKRTGDGFQMNANYDKQEYVKLRTMELSGEDYDLAFWKGATAQSSGTQVTPDGHDGKWSFKGRIAVGTNEGGVDDPFEMAVTVFPSSPVDFA